MADVVPKRNLAPESEPWGRSIDKAIADLSFNATKNAQDNSNAFAAINSSMKLIGAQIGTISAQQIAISNQQIQILDLLANKIGYAGTSSFANGIAPGGSFGNATSANLTLPSGVTTALVVVMAYTDTSYTGTSGAFCNYYSRCSINGTNGTSALKDGLIGYSDPHTSVFQQLVISSPPTTVPVAVQWAQGSGTAVGGNARLVAFAIFNK